MNLLGKIDLNILFQVFFNMICYFFGRENVFTTKKSLLHHAYKTKRLNLLKYRCILTKKFLKLYFTRISTKSY